MKIRPLKGYCLIQILPRDAESSGGVVIPETAQLVRKGEKLPAVKGIVRRVGLWPQKPNGYCVLPEFTVGDQVLLSQYVGTQMDQEIGPDFRMVKIEDVLAVLTGDGPMV